MVNEGIKTLYSESGGVTAREQKTEGLSTKCRETAVSPRCKTQLPEAGNGGGLDEEVFESVLPEGGWVCRLQLFVRSFDEDAWTCSVL